MLYFMAISIMRQLQAPLSLDADIMEAVSELPPGMLQSRAPALAHPLLGRMLALLHLVNEDQCVLVEAITMQHLNEVSYAFGGRGEGADVLVAVTPELISFIEWAAPLAREGAPAGSRILLLFGGQVNSSLCLS